MNQVKLLAVRITIQSEMQKIATKNKTLIYSKIKQKTPIIQYNFRCQYLSDKVLLRSELHNLRSAANL